MTEHICVQGKGLDAGSFGSATLNFFYIMKARERSPKYEVLNCYLLFVKVGAYVSLASL